MIFIKRLTHEEFLEKFKNNPHYNDIKLLGVYVNRRTPIECECKKCGYKWGANPYNLAYKETGCPACPSKEKFKMSFEKKVQDLQNYPCAKIFNFNKEIYINGHWDIEITCKKCGYTYVPSYSTLHRLKFCPQCWKEDRLTCEETFFKKFNETEQSKTTILKSNFINSETKIDCKCSVCGHEWSSFPNNLLLHGCAICSAKKRGNERILKNKDKNLKKLSKKFSHIKCVNYIALNSDEDEFHCEIHNINYKTSLYSVLKSIMGCCPNCIADYKRNLYLDTDESFQEKLSKLNPSLILNSKYIDSKTIVSILCKDCGKTMDVIPNSIIQNPKCSYCNDGWSFPNKFIRSFLFQSDVDYFKFEYSPEWANKKRYDAYFEKDGKPYIIEMDGKQHHENWIYGTKEYQQSNDKLKDELAKKQGIKVIRIDCSKQYLIKNNLMNSELSSILDLSKIDFNECTKFAFSSLMKSVCERYENDKTICSNDLVDIFQLSKGTIIRYLRFGNEIGLCTFNKSESKIRRDKLRRF